MVEFSTLILGAFAQSMTRAKSNLLCFPPSQFSTTIGRGRHMGFLDGLHRHHHIISRWNAWMSQEKRCDRTRKHKKIKMNDIIHKIYGKAFNFGSGTKQKKWFGAFHVIRFNTEPLSGPASQGPRHEGIPLAVLDGSRTMIVILTHCWPIGWYLK